MLEDYGLIPEIEPRYRSQYFAHIFAGVIPPAIMLISGLKYWMRMDLWRLRKVAIFITPSLQPS